MIEYRKQSDVCREALHGGAPCSTLLVNSTRIFVYLFL